MNKNIFSRKNEISPKEIWKETEFSKWFESQEGKEYLEEILNIRILSIETEKQVGNYRLDVYAIEEETGHAIIIENQYGVADHKHLGQLITYASGLSNSENPIKHIIWISEESREEAEAAIKWLNDITNASLNFFLLKPKIYSIGNSEEKIFEFDVIVKPNDFSKAIQKNTLNDGNKFSTLVDSYLDFWMQFSDYLEKNNIKMRRVKARPQKWMFNWPSKNQNVFDVRKSPFGLNREIAYKFCIYDKNQHFRIKQKQEELFKMFNNQFNIVFTSDENIYEWGFIVYSGISFDIENYEDAFKFYIDMYKKAEEIQEVINEM